MHCNNLSRAAGSWFEKQHLTLLYNYALRCGDGDDGDGVVAQFPIPQF
jgi:hypothetical protein